MAKNTAPTTTEGEVPEVETKPKKAVKPEAKVHVGLLECIKQYDTHVAEAETYYIEMIEIIQTEQISRADVVATMMKARGISFETAQSQYSRMKGIFSNKEVLEKLKNGEITLKVAREATTKKQANPTKDKAVDPAKKEERFEKAVNSVVASAKECGFDRKSVLTSIEAALKAAGIA